MESKIVQLVPKKDRPTDTERKARLLELLDDVKRAVVDDEIDGIFLLGFNEKGTYRWQHTKFTPEELIGRIEIGKIMMAIDSK